MMETPSFRISSFTIGSASSSSREISVRKAIRSSLAPRSLIRMGLRTHRDKIAMIESYAILRGETTLTEERLQTMIQALMEARSALQEEAYEPWHQASLRFHDAIVALADNDYLQGMYEQVKRSVRSYQILLIQVPTQPMRSQADHENVLEALNHRDIPRALERLREHFGSIETTIRLNLGQILRGANCCKSSSLWMPDRRRRSIGRVKWMHRNSASAGPAAQAPRNRSGQVTGHQPAADLRQYIRLRTDWPLV